MYVEKKERKQKNKKEKKKGRAVTSARRYLLRRNE